MAFSHITRIRHPAMRLNLSIATADVTASRDPIIGEDAQVYFAPENCEHLGSIRCTGVSAAEYTSAGGLGIPTGGRDCQVRINSANFRGDGSSAPTVTFNVVLDDDTSDTAVATFHLPTWAPAGSMNVWPYGIVADLIPATGGNENKKIKSITSLASVANMKAGNGLELFTSPDADSFVYIDCARNKGGAFNLPSIIEIACGRNPAAFTALGRGESNPLRVEFVNRGALEQLAIFNGHQGTLRMDIVKSDSYLTQRQLYTGFFVRSNGDIPDTGESLNTAEGPYTRFMIGYQRVA